MTRDVRRHAWRAIILFGVVSLFADVTYEGARSISGPFLESLGASAAIVGIVAGAGEFIGYGLRIVSGLFADRVRRYWLITFVGYAINLLAVPLLAFVGHWPAAVALLLAERFGKAVRNPSRDALLSGAAEKVGTGRGFGLHEALDQIGAVTGPLVVAAAVAHGGQYRAGFLVLIVPALLALATLGWTRRELSDVEARSKTPHDAGSERLPRAFRFYLAGAALLAFGTADFPLIAYRLSEAQVVAASTIPLLYAVAMAADAVSALLFGWLYDRFGFSILALAGLIAVPATALSFLGGVGAATAGVILWGAVLGAHESVVRAGVATLSPAGRRATAYGLFYAAYGGGWFLGSAAMGLAYGRSLALLVALSATASLAALVPILAVGGRSGGDRRSGPRS